MATYLTEETDLEYTPADHEVADEEEEKMRELLAKQMGLDSAEDIEAHLKKDQSHKHNICSCGYFSCPMIVHYGHPVPIFKEDIEPLHPQTVRDIRALELKAN